MTPLEAVKAIAQMGNVPSEMVAALVKSRFGIEIEPRFVPLFRATILHSQHSDAVRSRARTVVEPISTDKVDGPAEVRKLARELMDQHGLQGWSFRFNRCKQTLGLCVYSRRTIELSIYFVQRNPAAEIRDTILHEIAHALVGPSHGHDKVWKRKCIAIGARPQRCGQAVMPAGSWKSRCQGCGRCFDRHRKPKRNTGWHCRQCGTEKGRLVWRKAG